MAVLCLSREDEINIKQIPTEIPTPTLEDFKRYCLTLLTYISGDWFNNNMRNPKSNTKNPGSSKKKQEDKLKGQLKFVCYHWKYWKFQTH